MKSKGKGAGHFEDWKRIKKLKKGEEWEAVSICFLFGCRDFKRAEGERSEGWFSG